MANAQLREVFEKIQRVHREAASCYADMTALPDRRLAMLGEVFRRREQVFARRLMAFKANEHPSVLDTWVKYVPFDRVEEALAAIQAEREKDPEACLQQCLELQQRLARFLREMADKLSAPNVREFLEGLADCEEKAVRDFWFAMLTEHDA